jgi:hypothetical protein
MSAFALTEEQLEFADHVRDVATSKLSSLAHHGSAGSENRPLLTAMGDH